MHSVTRDCSDLSLFVLVISKFLKTLGLQPQISKVFRSLDQFFLTVGQNNFGNKIPFLYQGCEIVVIIVALCTGLH